MGLNDKGFGDIRIDCERGKRTLISCERTGMAICDL